MNSFLNYSVQLITNADQLTEALGLRYRTYKTVYPTLVSDIDRPFESDDFDKRSIHLGLYCEEGNKKKLAGYCRLILPEFFANDFSHVLVKNHSEYQYGKKNIGNEKLALMERLVDASSHEAINSFCTSLESKRTVYAETSRFIIDEEHRSISLSAFFVSSMFAVCESLNIKYSFFTCNHHHVPFYNRFGLTLFPGIAPFFSETFGTQYVVFGTDLYIANSQKNSIKILRSQLESENQMTYKKKAA